ncbi:MAG: hypothetical protein EBR49_03060 [Betaproteobacteria bacterium]|nr:hypothetical protein [Betaproteobacteria bacterium]
MKSAALCIALAIGSLVVGGYLAGLFGIVLAAPLAGALLSRVLIDGVAGGYGAMRAHAYASVQGRHYAYKSIPISIEEDGDGHRWIRIKDVRRVLPHLPKDATLGHIEPERTNSGPDGKNMHIRADALLHWLSKAQSSESIRFKLWIERTVHFPSSAAISGRAHAAPSLNDAGD